ncbi:MAG: tetratricopeptide repeat protein [Verrucomicrobiota bacterium]
MTPQEIQTLFSEAIRAEQKGDFSLAESVYRKLLVVAPGSPEPYSNLAAILLRENKYPEAVKLCHRAISLKPDFRTAYYNLGTAHLRGEEWPSAVEAYRKAVELQPDDVRSRSNLTRALAWLGEKEAAFTEGQKTLEWKDQLSCEAFRRRGQTDVYQPRREARPFDPTRRSANVISYSLWGDQTIYLDGALENVRVAADLFPEWTVRMYIDAETVPGTVQSELRRRGADLISMKRDHDWEGLFWRFLASDDSKVDYFLSRDCDSILSERERIAIDEWLDSGEPFHLMRDFVLHTDLILAGLWGGAANWLPRFADAVGPFVSDKFHRWVDQEFLGIHVWPLIRDHSLTHDRHYCVGRSRPFPNEAPLPDGFHVGSRMDSE